MKLYDNIYKYINMTYITSEREAQFGELIADSKFR